MYIHTIDKDSKAYKSMDYSEFFEAVETGLERVLKEELLKKERRSGGMGPRERRFVLRTILFYIYFVYSTVGFLYYVNSRHRRFMT